MISDTFNYLERPGIQESGFEVTFNLQSGASIKEVSVYGIRILDKTVQYKTCNGIDIWIPKCLIFKHKKDAELAIRIVIQYIFVACLDGRWWGGELE